MLGVAFRSDAGYLTKHVSEHHSPERGNYYLSAAEHGEPPGRWIGTGAAQLGLEGDVDADVMRRLYNELIHPVTGELLGRRPYRFGDTAARLEQLLAAEGSGVLPERERELSLEASRQHREARTYADCTFSMPKSWSVFHASLERAGKAEDAEQVWAAVMDGVEAGLDYLREHAGYSRAGRHGIEVAGRTSGRWVEGKGWIVSAWRHHTSRDGDPQLHVHAAVLNRVLCDDGKWRTLDSRAIYRARRAAGAISERAAEESLTRRLGVEFALRADGKAREIMGIDEPTRDLFSSRRRAISQDIAARVGAYEATYGHTPSAYTLRLMAEQATLKTRARKPEHPPTRGELLESWEGRVRAELGQRLDDVAEQVARVDEPVAVPFEPDRVIARALAAVQESRSVWTRHDLVAELNTVLPDCLGGLSARAVQSLVDELADRALSPGGSAVKLTAPELVPAPPELRQANGRSIYEPPTADRYTTRAQLADEEYVVAAAARTDAPRLEPERAELFLGASPLSPAQAAAVAALLTSGRRVETFIGAPGVGKTFTSAELARLWRETTGAPVLGLTTAERARQVLAEEGFTDSSNIRRWLDSQARLEMRLGALQASERDLSAIHASRALTASEEARRAQLQAHIGQLGVQRLQPGQLVVVDEASMVTTRDLAAIVRYAEAAGAKTVLSGDDRQLAAPGAGGMFRLLAQEPSAVRLEEVRRFKHNWEAGASLQLREGDAAALLEYERHGRIVDGSRVEIIAAATQALTADLLAGRRSLLIVPTNEDASRLSSEVREQLVQLGHVAPQGVVLRDDNRAGIGDIVATRRNDWLLGVVNRELYRVVQVAENGGLVVERLDAETVEREVKTLPAGYVGTEVELAYASTAHSAQGRTVERGYQLVDERSGRAQLLVGATRGSELNVMFVVTHDEELELPAQRQDRMALLLSVMEREDDEQAALEVLREELAGAESLGRLEPQWADVMGSANVERYQQLLRARLGDVLMDRVLAEDGEASLYRLLRALELQGRRAEDVIEHVSRRELESADEVSSVLHWRIDHLGGRRTTAASYLERTPAGDTAELRWARGLAHAMDQRVIELGEQASLAPPPWLAELGPVPEEAAARLQWIERAGVVAAYREAHGYGSEREAIGSAPPRGAVEARSSWDRAYEALGRPTDLRDLSAATDVELERLIDDWEREQRWAPAHVDQELAESHLAARRWETEAVLEQSLEKQLIAAEIRQRAAQLEGIAAARQAWYAETASARERGQAARRELDRRQPERAVSEPPPAADSAGRVEGVALDHAGATHGQRVPLRHIPLWPDGKVPPIPERPCVIEVELDRARAARAVIRERDAERAEAERAAGQRRREEFEVQRQEPVIERTRE